MSKGVTVKQRLEDLKTYVYDELNRLKIEIQKSGCGDIPNAVGCSVKHFETLTGHNRNYYFSKYKKERHQKSYRRVKNSNCRKYRH